MQLVMDVFLFTSQRTARPSARPSAQVTSGARRFGMVAVALTLAAAPLAHCSSGTPGFGASEDGGTSSSSGVTPIGGDDGGVIPLGDTGTVKPPVGEVLLYAHTDTTLYSLNPKNPAAAPTEIGDFDCIDDVDVRVMTDFAVTKDGRMFGVSAPKKPSDSGFVYPLEVEGKAVRCKDSWKLPPDTKFYGLTLAPEGVLGSEEVLVAANSEGGLFTIDKETGKTTDVGNLGYASSGGKQRDYALSGDIVFLENNGNPVGFATVKACDDVTKPNTCDTFDSLIELDVRKIKPGAASTWKKTRGPLKAGNQTFKQVFGLAAYNDKVYGFNRVGDILEINNANGSTKVLGSNTGIKFSGAGVTTSAPVIVSPN
jgi:hypothetical protein